MSILFILRANECSAGYSSAKASGLKNSATLVADMLNIFGVKADVTTVIDSNGIDHEVSIYRPKIVVLEAIWCPPYKLQELAKLWPKVRWIVRVHSEIPFLANEGQAIAWLFAYKDLPHVRVAANSPVAFRDLWQLNPLYLPNFYPIDCLKAFPKERKVLKIGCFGAVRPLKNQLAQAFAAIEYASRHNRPLEFYINASRTEQGGDQALKNIRSLFAAQTKDFQLMEIPWSDRDQFLELVRDMDVCMNVSFSETFCIAAADAVSQFVPVITSPEIYWTAPEVQADPTSIHDIVSKLETVLSHRGKRLVHENYDGLRRYNELSIFEWLKL